MREIDSTVASHAHYDSDARRLKVRFKDSGKTYAYEGVPDDVAHVVLNAPSFGKALGHHVLGRYKARKV